MNINEKNETIESALDRLAKITTEVVDKMPPRYLVYESLHPKKKPRGSIRRKRRVKNE